MCAWLRRRHGSASCVERSPLEATTASGGGTAAAVTARASLQPPTPSAADDAAWRDAKATASFDARLQLFPLLTHGATQAITLLLWRSMPAAEIAQRVASTLLVALFWVLPTFWPVQYMRHRTLCVLSSRISFFAWPLLRRPAGIQQVLESAAAAGLRGALRDVFKIVWGARLVAVMLLSFITPLSMLPFSVHLLLQLYAVLMVRGNSSLCATPLLRDPLTRLRIGRFHSVMGLAAGALPGGVGFALRARVVESLSATAECEAFLTCLSVTLALLLPAYVAVKTEPASSLQRWEQQAQLDRAASDSSASSASTSDTALGRRESSTSYGSAAASACRLSSFLTRVESSVGGGIRNIFCGPSWLAEAGAPNASTAGTAGAAGPGQQLAWYQRLAAWWLLLALVYELALVAAH